MSTGSVASESARKKPGEDSRGASSQPEDPQKNNLVLFDTTLRDGEQREGVNLNIEDKLRIARRLDELGVDYIEGGFPASNERDRELFERLAAEGLKNSTLAAFGMTRRKNLAAADDEGLHALAVCAAPVIVLVGKSSVSQVELILETNVEENLAMIGESVEFLRLQGKRVFFDAEHYFDAWLEDPKYALQALEAAWLAGAEYLVLCDTNGGMLPHQIYEACQDTLAALKGSAAISSYAEGHPERAVPALGIHCHNDSGCAVANSMEAVRAGVIHVQGTVNGYGERVGNADLLTILVNLQLKLGYQLVSDEQLAGLTDLSHYVAETMNITPDPHHPFVGTNAFAHKGGMHSSAVLRYKPAYEHIQPEKIGNFSHIVVSELAGRAALASKAAELNVSLPEDPDSLAELLAGVKEREANGYSYEVADASLALLLARRSNELVECFELESFRVITERQADGRTNSEATVKLWVNGQRFVATGEGNGPVNALDAALRLAITANYPETESFELSDYKVRVLDDSTGTGAVTRVVIETRDIDSTRSWGTVGVSENIIEASWDALVDAITYGLLTSSRE
ncbi:MAG: citramalate synthase [Coriobacteriia bacterium]|nr:citramalate synthase [Coriobacteriia bacterium]